MAATSVAVVVLPRLPIAEVIAGTGILSTSGDGGPATSAGLNDPGFVTLGPDGAIYIADFDANLIRRVDEAGLITSFAGTGVLGFSGDGTPPVATAMSNPTGCSAFGPDRFAVLRRSKQSPGSAVPGEQGRRHRRWQG